MQTFSEKSAWYKKSNPETLGDRIKSVQNVNDPTLIADDVQRWSTRFIWLLLVFTTLLSGFSYYKFFEPSFGVVSILMAVSLAITIEFGKNWAFLKVLRIPFFLGWGHIQKAVEDSILWVGLLLLSGVCFAASVYNSTHGAHALALMLSQERTHSEFKPNTADLDGQILAVQKSMAENRAIKWRGTVTYQAQRAINKEAGAVDKLQAQKAAALDQQRKDWEQDRETNNSRNSFSANSLLLVGGFVELLQFLLMFMRVSAERSLDKTGSERRASAPEFQTIRNPSAQESTFAQNNAPSKIGFYWKGYGQSPKSGNVTQKDKIVSQPPEVVTQPSQHISASIGSDKILLSLRTKLQAEIPNLVKRNGVRETVCCRILKAFNECFLEMKKRDFKPSKEVASRVFDYLVNESYPVLNEQGLDLKYNSDFLGLLYEFTV
jgi:hypothetical protein